MHTHSHMYTHTHTHVHTHTHTHTHTCTHTRAHTQCRISIIENLFLSISTGNVRRLSESFNGTGSQKDGIF